MKILEAMSQLEIDPINIFIEAGDTRRPSGGVSVISDCSVNSGAATSPT